MSVNRTKVSLVILSLFVIYLSIITVQSKTKIFQNLFMDFFLTAWLLLYFIEQEKAVKWCNDEHVDGLTTNGVFIMQPLGGFTPAGKPGNWREVSVGGGIFSLRDSRPSHLKSHQVKLFQYCHYGWNYIFSGHTFVCIPLIHLDWNTVQLLKIRNLNFKNINS